MACVSLSESGHKMFGHSVCHTQDIGHVVRLNFYQAYRDKGPTPWRFHSGAAENGRVRQAGVDS